MFDPLLGSASDRPFSERDGLQLLAQGSGDINLLEHILKRKGAIFAHEPHDAAVAGNMSVIVSAVGRPARKELAASGAVADRQHALALHAPHDFLHRRADALTNIELRLAAVGHEEISPRERRHETHALALEGTEPPVSYTHLDVYKRQVAHRLSTVAALDRIVVLADGEIVEDGTHAELAAAGGEYAALWNRQTGAFLESE